MVISEILINEQPKKNVDAIIALELANQMLHENAKNLQEALAAYQIHITKDIHKEPSLEKRFSMFNVDKEMAKTLDGTRSIFDDAAETIKTEILSNEKVKKIYYEMLWLGETFHDDFFPISVATTSLNLKHDLHPHEILTMNPTTNVEWRFETIIESLRNLERKGISRSIPRFSSDAGAIIEHHDQTKFDYFIRRITGLETSLTDGHYKGIDEHITDMLFYPIIDPNNEYSNNSSKFERFDLLYNAREEQRYLFGLAEFNIWTGFKINEKILLSPNTRLVPDKILVNWLQFFSCWLLKECIITEKNIDDKFSTIPMLNESRDDEIFQRAKSLQQ